MTYSDLMRRPHRGKPWPTYWYDPLNGELLSPGTPASVFIQPDDLSVAPLLAYLALPGQNVETYHAVVYLAVGDQAYTAPPEDYYRSAALDGWAVDYRGGSPKDRAAICSKGGVTIHVRHTATWFGAGANLRQMRSAYLALGKRLQRDFGGEGDTVTLLGTPAQTGLLLLDLSLPRDKDDKPYRYPVLPDELTTFLSKVGFQHRKELLNLGDDSIPGFTVYDARLAYAAYLRDAPVGLPHIDEGAEFVPYRPGWYQALVEAPAGWRHIGLARDFLVSAMAPDAWPRSGKWETWISEPELRLLKSQGWGFTIRQRIIWPVRKPGDDPLRAWGDRLVRAYIDAEQQADPELSRLLRGAVRHLIHDTIGSFRRSAAYKRVTLPFGSPVDPATIEEQTPYGYLCKLPVAISNDRMRYYQPQIPGHIWARNRAALGRFALTLPFDDLLALLTDAALVSRYIGYAQRRAVDIGAYRCKGTMDGPLPAPNGWQEIAELTHAAEATYGAFYGELYDAREELADGEA